MTVGISSSLVKACADGTSGNTSKGYAYKGQVPVQCGYPPGTCTYSLPLDSVTFNVEEGSRGASKVVIEAYRGEGHDVDSRGQHLPANFGEPVYMLEISARAGELPDVRSCGSARVEHDITREDFERERNRVRLKPDTPPIRFAIPTRDEAPSLMIGVISMAGQHQASDDPEPDSGHGRAR